MASKITVEIIDISSTGEGIARHNGKVYFVSGAVPQQYVEASIVQEKKNYALCTLLRVIHDTKERPELCPHIACGGCSLRSISYQEQCAYKERVLQNSFSKIAKLPDTLCMPIEYATNTTNYRLKTELHYGYTHDGKPNIGFYSHASHSIVPITQCPIIKPQVLSILSIAREILQESKEHVYTNGEGFWRCLVVRYSVAKQQFLVHCITTPQHASSKAYAEVQRLFSRITTECVDEENTYVCVHSIQSSKSTLAQGEEYIYGGETAFLDEIITIADKECSIRYGANSFFQNNHEMLERVYTAVHSHAQNATHAVDICCGVGSISISALRNVPHCSGIDYNKEAIYFATYNAQKNLLPIHYSTIHMKKLTMDFLRKNTTLNNATKILLSTLQQKHSSLVVLDPPRSGIHKELLDVLMQSTVKRIIYVSCNPATLARDCAILAKKYCIIHSTPYDMFPHTYHCESVTVLERL